MKYALIALILLAGCKKTDQAGTPAGQLHIHVHANSKNVKYLNINAKEDVQRSVTYGTDYILVFDFNREHSKGLDYDTFVNVLHGGKGSITSIGYTDGSNLTSATDSVEVSLSGANVIFQKTPAGADFETP